MSTTINAQNPDQIIYDNSLIKLTVLGGIKLQGLDRMRATLKAEIPDSPKPPIRHNLDLYNDTQLEKFIRKTADRLEIGTSVIAASLSELTQQLEFYRLQQIKEQQPEELKPKQLNETEKESATEYLSDPKLIENTIDNLQRTGIIGEPVNGMLLFMAMTSRKCSDPLSVICLASSGTGKSYLMEKVAACFPYEDILENTQFTENSFYYFKREELRNKILLIEDLDGAEGVLYPIRELQSKKRISKTVTAKDTQGVNRTITLTVEGPVSVIGCTTREKIYEDNSNRSLLVYLDDSKEQDLRIQQYQKELKAGLTNAEEEEKIRLSLQNVQRVLEPIKIVNPYAPLIGLPQAVFKPRRTMGLLLSFIESITFYNQKQREQKVNKETGEIWIETTPQDIEWAFRLLKETLFRKSDELSGACRTFYEQLKGELLKEIDQNKKVSEKEIIKGFYASDIRKQIRINPRTLHRYLSELNEYHYIKIVGGNKHKTGYLYRINEEFKRADIQTEIDTQIAQVLENIEVEHGKRSKPKTRKKSVSKKAVSQ